MNVRPNEGRMRERSNGKSGGGAGVPIFLARDRTDIHALRSMFAVVEKARRI